ncbi:intraflagellar transport protein 57 homolog [Anthonomus grandis grandis]|uniref:intraflagellar transport protein 57 homolog n=1 Tax=Anthonomus grandis grandis TaxID=2921223 RepID=UPI002164F952|nr:intraflagellar transport protein 57 homolog [Anthonomus grandis grandis]
MALREKKQPVDSLFAIGTNYVANNLSFYSTGENILEWLPPNIKNNLLRKITCTSYFSRNVNFTDFFKVLVNPSTEEINLTCMAVTDEMLNALHCCSNVRKIHLTVDGNSCTFTTKGLLNLFPNTPKLENLIIMKSKEVNDDVLQCISLHCPRLKGLSIGGCVNVTDKGLEFLSSMRISWLGISQTKITDKGIIKLVQGESGPILTEIIIDNCAQITNLGLNKITECCPNLKILNFQNCDTDILITSVFSCSKFNMKQIFWQIPLYYFAIPKNSGEQFYLFAVLSAWLLRKIGKEFENPHEYDDPNSTIEKIINEAKQLGMQIDFPANKLKQGVGDQVVNILDFLATAAINKQHLIFQKPKLPEEKEQETEVIDDESELNLDRVEEEMIAAYSDDSDEENIFRLDDIKPVKRDMQQIDLKGNVDEESWKLEIERVLPLLKVTIKNENRDWRSHLDLMKSYKQSINETLLPTKTQLEKLHKEIGSTLDKIENREKYLNRELDGVLENYRTLQDQLSKIKEKYKSVSTGVAERNRELNNLNGKVESIKQQMEERGSSMTDGTPLVNIKKAIAKIKSEITNMDVRIGVLQCLLLQTKLREEKQLEHEFENTSVPVF